MKKKLQLIAALLLPLAPAPLLAQSTPEPYFTCVQTQLKALKMPGISVTGRPDAATKSATEALRKQYPSARGLALLPAISDLSAVSWCREIAALKPALRKHMPGAAPPIYAGQGGEGSPQTRFLKATFGKVERFFHSHYGIYPASRTDVAGADSGRVLAELAVSLQRRRGRSYGRMDTAVTRYCASPSQRYGGLAYQDQLLLCWPRGDRFDRKWQARIAPRVTAIMAHEFMHHVQRELANDKVWKGSYRARSKRGPAWMVEGSAELAEYNWRVLRGGLRRMPLEKLQKPARESKKGLRAMHNHGAVKGGQQYATAGFAVYLLAQRFGEDKVLDYWRYIGQGKSWEKAFKASFGMSLGEYSRLFETLRKDSARAAAFIAGK